MADNSNPPFQPLTLSVEEWARHCERKQIRVDEHSPWLPCDVSVLADELTAQAQKAASLQQRLEKLQKEHDVGYRGFPACNHADLKAQLEQAQQERDLLRIDRDSWRRVSETLESQRSRAEAALAEMQKRLDWALTLRDEAVAELQRRRSAPGQEKA